VLGFIVGSGLGCGIIFGLIVLEAGGCVLKPGWTKNESQLKKIAS